MAHFCVRVLCPRSATANHIRSTCLRRPCYLQVVPISRVSTSQLRQGAHGPHCALHKKKVPGIGRLAGKLGIDYAEAVVGFDFKKQRVVPVKEGIVIPIESRELLLQVHMIRTRKHSAR